SMNRRKLEAHLREHGCSLHHNGAKHDIWVNPVNEQLASVPRHKQIKKGTVRGICRTLDIPLPDGL
ncbi:MAG TPA: type II toxin-antitoxin system HicA family toxin, partial [Gemmataceae bacterium]|nr:type II toxin-antitoxin system HicA family toxin [Gemmataceae bacterium]